MGYNIYYMYDINSGYGYIGQNTKEPDDYRIIEHYDAFLKPQIKKDGSIAYDGGAELIKKAGLMNVRYKIFTDETYGIPVNVYNEFLKVWYVHPEKETLWNELTKEEKLDLAEIMHNIWAHLHGRKWNTYNKLIGGFSYQEKRNPNAMRTLTYRFNNDEMEKIKKVYTEANLTPPTEYTAERFKFRQLYLENKDVTINDFAKLIHPAQHVAIKDLITSACYDIFSEFFNSFFRDSIFENSTINRQFMGNLSKIVESTVVNQFSDPKGFADMLKKLSGTHSVINAAKDGYIKVDKRGDIKRNKDFVKAIIQSFKTQKIKKELMQLKKKLQVAINRVAHSFDVKWNYNIDYNIVSKWVNQIIDKISNLSITKIAKIFEFKNGRYHIDLTEIFDTIPVQLNIQIQEKRTIEPTWVEKLKHVDLFSNWKNVETNSKLKVAICKNVCEQLLPEVKKIIPSKYSVNKTLQSRLYDRLNPENVNYSWDFCRIFLEVWHEYTYGSNAWVQKKDTTFYSPDMPKYEQYFFARKDIVEHAEAKKKEHKSFQLHWYKGTFYESSGVSQGDLDAAAKVLAERWRW